MTGTQSLVIAECRRIIELIHCGELKPNEWGHAPDRGELRAKMAELRRDTIRLEKELYER